MRKLNIPIGTSKTQAKSELYTAPQVTSLPGSVIPDPGRDQLQLYQIEVRAQGNVIAEHVIVAGSALKAINLVESEYGAPVRVETAMVEDGEGGGRQVTIARNWHGYSFDARALGIRVPK